MYEIKAVVRFNDCEALVLSEKPKITYEKHGNFLFGLDKYGLFAGSYGYEAPGEKWKAFGGNKFDIPMTDGSVIKAYGQWWDNGTKDFSDALGYKIINVTAKEIEDLKRCYVFNGHKAVEEEYTNFRKTYTGEIYEYWEYDFVLRGKSFQWERDPKNPKNK